MHKKSFERYTMEEVISQLESRPLVTFNNSKPPNSQPWNSYEIDIRDIDINSIERCKHLDTVTDSISRFIDNLILEELINRKSLIPISEINIEQILELVIPPTIIYYPLKLYTEVVSYNKDTIRSYLDKLPYVIDFITFYGATWLNSHKSIIVVNGIKPFYLYYDIKYDGGKLICNYLITYNNNTSINVLKLQ